MYDGIKLKATPVAQLNVKYLLSAWTQVLIDKIHIMLGQYILCCTDSINSNNNNCTTNLILILGTM